MLKTIGNQFRRPSGFLGRVISKLMIKGNKNAYDIIIRELDIKTNDKLFEIGYGHGLGIYNILSNYECHISGIDFSELMFKEATNRNRKFIENKKSKLGFGDFLSSDITQNQFDKVFCLNVIYFWDNLEVPFTKIRSILNDDGVFCFFMADKEDLKRLKFTKDEIFNKYSIEQVVGSLSNSGFKDISYKTDKGYYVKCKK